MTVFERERPNGSVFLRTERIRPARPDDVFYYSSKRALDFICAAILLIGLAPLILIVALVIRMDSPGPAIFRQQRVGTRRRFQDGQWRWELVPFTIYKYRTMFKDADSRLHEEFIRSYMKNDVDGMKRMNAGAEKEAEITFKLVRDPRVTRIGRFLRATSIDELPQLFNVFLGNMSLVGPRPALAYEVKDYTPEQMERFTAKPGMTGLWQVEGRGLASFDEMISQDIEYTVRQSFWLDLYILFKTPFVVLLRKGAA